MFVPFEEDGPRDPVKICRLRLRNHSSRKRRLDGDVLCGMGAGYAARGSGICTSPPASMRNRARCWRGRAGRPIAGMPSRLPPCIPRATSYSGDRALFLGRNGSRCQSGRAEIGSSRQCRGGHRIRRRRCRLPLLFESAVRADVVFLLGQAPDIDEVREIVGTFRDPAAVEQGTDATSQTGGMPGWARCRSTRRTLSVDLLLNRWLLYQALSCRFWGTVGAVSIERRIRISRSVAGFAGLAVRRARTRSRAYSACGLAPIPRKGMSSTGGIPVPAWESEPDARTTCCGCPMRSPSTSKVTGDTAILDEPVPFLEGPAARARRDGASVHAGGFRGDERLCGITAAEPRVRLAHWPAWIAAVRQRRLERRHEPGRTSKAAARASGWPGSCVQFCAPSLNWRTPAIVHWAAQLPGASRAIGEGHRSNPAGMASGICADSSTTGRRSDRTPTAKRGSIRCLSPGRSFPEAAIRRARRLRWSRPIASWSRERERIVLSVHSAFRSFRAASRLHHGLSARHSRERRPIHARVFMAGDGMGATGRRRACGAVAAT